MQTTQRQCPGVLPLLTFSVAQHTSQQTVQSVVCIPVCSFTYKKRRDLTTGAWPPSNTWHSANKIAKRKRVYNNYSNNQGSKQLSKVKVTQLASNTKLKGKTIAGW